LISFGFWAGDQKVREPSYYSYTAPEPANLHQRPLEPEAAFWTEPGTSALGSFHTGQSARQPTRKERCSRSWRARIKPAREQRGGTSPSSRRRSVVHEF